MRQLTITSRLTNRETDSFNQYLKEIADIDKLTPEEELVLTSRTVLGDKEAINELVSRNLRFVVSVAKQYITSSTPLEDLVNEGNIGLIKAAELFKPEMGNKFISYAVFWIRKSILQYLATNNKIVRLPANKINNLSKLEKKINILEQRHSRHIDISEIISEFGDEFNNENIELLEVLSTYTVGSIDREVNDEEGHTTLSELISDDSTNNLTDHLVVESDIKCEVKRILNTLKPRDRRIMIALYGLDGGFPLTLQEVSVEIGISREMIRQIRKKTLTKLNKQLANSSIIDCL